ncbi:MAG: diaminopimelate epimerase [Chloroflexi bacterium]|nr:diaminopimelate epimerase [Chloroflexota bacterium]
MRFTKMHGAGNDYVLLDARNIQADWHGLARDMCDRHMGIGSDGILLVMPSESADVRMRMFNPDGSEAEMCGNGIRCLAKYVLERGIAKVGEQPLRVETMAGLKVVEPCWSDGKVVRARVGMGEPELRPDKVPVALPEGLIQIPVLDYPLSVEDVDLKLTFVSMGNPHAIAFIDTPVKEFPLHSIGPLVEHHAIFPNQVNFSVVNTNGHDRITARVWERGVGETLACGTGACAIAVASRLHDLTGDSVDITLPGGTLGISLDSKGQVWLEGPAEEVFQGEWRG